MNMTPEINLIKSIIRAMVAGKEKEIKVLLNPRHINWETFKGLSIYHELAPFAYFALQSSNSFLPQALSEFLKNNYYCALVRCQSLWQEFLRIAIAFEQARITLLPIKGIALLEDLYTQTPFRLMTDIDLLAREEDLQKAEMIFCDLGYRKELYGLREEYWRENQCHITFYKKEKEGEPFIELHWSIDFKRKGRAILPELWQRIREINIDGRRIKLLSPEDTVFSLALHARRFGKTLCLKNVFDVILLLNKYAGSFDWEYCLKMSRKYRLCSTLFFILYQAKFLSGLKIPDFARRGLNLPKWKERIIQRFIEKNTFSPDISKEGRDLYLRSHFLLYDSLREPIDYILNIPQEQFAKYYGLDTYDKKTDFLYRYRLFYMPLRLVSLLNSRNKLCH